MTTERPVDVQLRNIVESTRHLNEGTIRKLQTVSFKTVIWPILPNLPAEPQKAAELLKGTSLEQCDVCGCPATPGQKRKNVAPSARGGPSSSPGPGLASDAMKFSTPSTPSPDLAPETREGFSTGTGTRAATAPLAASPLTKMMQDIEKKVDATLNSIEKTTKQTDQLRVEAKRLEIANHGMTDAELVNTLKTLMKEKSKREERIKALELKEQELKESLKTAIDWAKSVDTVN